MPVKLSFNTTIVSVEHDIKDIDLETTLFQYNYCFGGTRLNNIVQVGTVVFQYNYCFGGTY